MCPLQRNVLYTPWHYRGQPGQGQTPFSLSLFHLVKFIIGSLDDSNNMCRILTNSLQGTVQATRARVQPLAGGEQRPLRVQDYGIEYASCHQGCGLEGGEVVCCGFCCDSSAPRAHPEKACTVFKVDLT